MRSDSGVAVLGLQNTQPKDRRLHRASIDIICVTVPRSWNAICPYVGLAEYCTMFFRTVNTKELQTLRYQSSYIA